MLIRKTLFNSKFFKTKFIFLSIFLVSFVSYAQMAKEKEAKLWKLRQNEIKILYQPPVTSEAKKHHFCV